MRDLQGIAEINGPRRVALQKERAKTVEYASANSVNPAAVQKAHGYRVATREATNVPDHPGTQEVSHPGINDPPLVKFWYKLNHERRAAGLPEASYKEAREAFELTGTANMARIRESSRANRKLTKLTKLAPVVVIHHPDQSSDPVIYGPFADEFAANSWADRSLGSALHWYWLPMTAPKRLETK